MHSALVMQSDVHVGPLNHALTLLLPSMCSPYDVVLRCAHNKCLASYQILC